MLILETSRFSSMITKSDGGMGDAGIYSHNTQYSEEICNEAGLTITKVQRSNVKF